MNGEIAKLDVALVALTWVNALYNASMLNCVARPMEPPDNSLYLLNLGTLAFLVSILTPAD